VSPPQTKAKTRRETDPAKGCPRQAGCSILNPMKHKNLLACFAAFICFSGLVSGDSGDSGDQGQSPAQGQIPSASDTAPESQTSPTFRVAIDLITTDVIPRQDTGQFVADLSKGEFEVYEDGVLQNISSMVLVHGGRVYNQLTPPPPPPQEGIILPPARPPSDAAGRVFILFVDDLHLNFRDTGRIRDLFKRISKSVIHEGDLFGILSTGPSSLSIDLTYDRTRIDEAIKKISGSGLKPSEIINGPDGASGPSEVRYRAHVAFSTATDLLKNLEKVNNRRKAVIYVSNGYDFNPFPKSRSGGLESNSPYESRMGSQLLQDDSEGSTRSSDPNAYNGQPFAEGDLVRDLSELARAANRANATLYTIDPRGLIAGQDLDEQVDPVEWQDYLRKSQDSLRVMADLTGGIAVVNSNDFDKALKRIDNETSDYYVLGYYSTNPDPTKRTRKIEVKVSRPDVTVWSRTFYSLRATPSSK
jgi:VWFA-related protein